MYRRWGGSFESTGFFDEKAGGLKGETHSLSKYSTVKITLVFTIASTFLCIVPTPLLSLVIYIDVYSEDK